FLLPVPAHNREITFLGFAPDGRLVTGSPDEVKVWNLDEVRTAPPIVLSGHEGTITALAFAPDEKLVTASTDRRVRVWDFNLDRLVRLAGKVAGRNLSEEEWEQSFVGEEYRRTFPELPDGAKVPETRPLQKAVGSSNPMVTPPAVTDSEARPRKGQNSE
ncbi:MAG: WD40 repeat domain-containing protein, partial [Isosphaeraceae bacterium]